MQGLGKDQRQEATVVTVARFSTARSGRPTVLARRSIRSRRRPDRGGNTAAITAKAIGRLRGAAASFRISCNEQSVINNGRRSSAETEDVVKLHLKNTPLPQVLSWLLMGRGSTFSMGLVAAIFGWTSVGGSAEVDFDRDVLPLLREHCLECHGPDIAESDLRLDSTLAALRGGDSGEQAIVPGNSDQSYLIERVRTNDVDQRMPPYSDPLSEQQIQTLQSWIEEASHWEAAEAELSSGELDHWSFQPVSSPSVPDPISDNPIDSFVRAKLKDAGFAASDAASRRRLIRRLNLVMLGLPPTPEQVRCFLNDKRPGAWERLVDEVLQSPHYGERWATHWLDLVRFGETHGFEMNRERPNAWRYRDWVIDALNDDKPYDQFIIEQLAGDVVGADVATGFLVAGPDDQVKGQNPELRMMQRQDELADMVNTTGTAFLGLTTGCARCHNHKFDPISQTDYYALQAVFAGVRHDDRALPLAAETIEKIAALDQEMSELKHALQKFVRREGVTPSSDTERKRSGSETARQEQRPPVNAQHNLETFAPISTRFVRMTIGATNGSQPCIDELEIFAGDENVGLASAGAETISSGDFVHPLHKLKHINDGQYGNSRSWIAAKTSGGWVQIELPESQQIDRIVWARDREGKYSDRLATEYRFEVSSDGENWQLVASSADRLPLEAESPAPIEYDFAAFAKAEAKQGRALLERLEQLTEQREVLSTPAMAYAGSFRQPEPTHRLYRGEPSAPREQVAPAAIQALDDLQLPEDSPEQQRRLAIAEWIADEQNPLTARVMVNRLWQFHFGTGIVDTPSDFGANGVEPTHPELLDWLASEFIDRGWSMKQMHRLILTSETWRQDSRPRSQTMMVDAGSRLLWRFPPRRLEAEGIRDSILAVTGKLDRRAGGPGFSAFRVEKENVRHYFPKSHFGPEDWRRMIYMTKVRQERDAVFGVFDCPDGSQVTPKRSRSTTPLQALNLLNSRFVVQQAEFFAARLEEEAKTPAEKVRRAYELCFSREPEPDEIETAIAFVEETDWHQFARAMLNASEFLFVP